MPHLLEEKLIDSVVLDRVSPRVKACTIYSVLAFFWASTMMVLSGCPKEERGISNPPLLSSPLCEAQYGAIPNESDRRTAIHNCAALNNLEQERRQSRRLKNAKLKEKKHPKDVNTQSLSSVLSFNSPL